jgi:hypothetical protein
VPPNITEDQFIFAAVTGIANGQNAKNHTGNRNRTAAILMGRPHFPRDQRRVGRGAPASRLQIRQLIVMK